jgi:hypothetical protein
MRNVNSLGVLTAGAVSVLFVGIALSSSDAPGSSGHVSRLGWFGSVDKASPEVVFAGGAALAQRSSRGASGPPSISDESLTHMVQRSCMVCHNDQLKTGNLSLQGFNVAEATEWTEASEKIIHKLRLEMMPPPGVPRPGGDSLLALATRLEEKIDLAASANPDPGFRRFQRLNRAEYARVIKDLLLLDVDPSRWLPPDVGKFDNEAAAQGLSTTSLQAYLQAAEEVARLAVGNPLASPTSRTYQVPISASQHAWDHVAGAPYGTRGGSVVDYHFPVDGNYVFSVETILGRGTSLEDIDVAVDGEQVALLGLEIGEADRVRTRMTEPVFVRAGQRRVSATFIRSIDGPYEDRLKPHSHSLAGGDTNASWADYGLTALPHLQSLTIAGPYESRGVSDSPSRDLIFSCRPETQAQERACAQSIVENLASKAFRRPVQESEVVRLMQFYDDGADARGFEVGVRNALQAVLSASSFIFRLERQPATTQIAGNFPVDDLALASRLSFFLWATAPDSELLRLAEEGILSQREILVGQVRRMLSDPRSEALSTRFAAQWLRLQNLEGAQPEPYYYPDYNRQLAQSMRRETELLFDYLIKQDRSFIEFFNAEYTFVDERLARHYGIPFSGGSEFRRVSISDRNRFGIFGHSSILTLTSLGNRTSPVKRGEWVMDVLLGSPPPPPPPNVPLLDETGSTLGGRFLTTRERMEIHRKNPTCNSCHQFIDPIGLALDHFDVTGQTRIRENSRPLSTQGTYYDGTQIGTPSELREVMLMRLEPLMRTFTKNLMGYALGRAVEYSDLPEVRSITRQAALQDYKMSAFIVGVIESDAFLTRRLTIATEDER